MGKPPFLLVCLIAAAAGAACSKKDDAPKKPFGAGKLYGACDTTAVPGHDPMCVESWGPVTPSDLKGMCEARGGVVVERCKPGATARCDREVGTATESRTFFYLSRETAERQCKDGTLSEP